MFTFLKKLFSKEEEIVQKELSLQEVEGWLDSKEKEKEEIFKERVEEFRQEFLEVKRGLEGQMEELQKATLQNTSIPPKAFHYMEGNRESYIRFMRQFLLATSETPKGQKDVESYCREFIGHLNHFAQVSQRNYFVLQNFFANTLKDIGQFLKTLEGHVKQLEEDFEHMRIKEVLTIKKELEDFKQKRAYKDLLKKEILEAESKVGSLAAYAKKAEESLQLAQAGDEWAQLKKEEFNLTKAIDVLKEKEQHVSMLFSPLDKALRKFSKDAFDNQLLIVQYGESPAQALEGDEQLAIVSILEKLGISLEKSGLGLDERRIQKASAAIKSLTKETLKQHQEELRQSKKQVGFIQERIASASIRQRHEGLKKALEVAQEAHERKKQELASLKGKFDDIDVQKLLSELEGSLNQKLGEHISIVMEKIE